MHKRMKSAYFFFYGKDEASLLRAIISLASRRFTRSARILSPFRKCNEISVTPIAHLYLNIIRIGNSREPTTVLWAAPLSSTPLAVKSRLELLSRRIADDPWPLLVAYWRYIACLSPVEHLLSARKSRVLLIFVDGENDRVADCVDWASRYRRSSQLGEIVKSSARIRENDRLRRSYARAERDNNWSSGSRYKPMAL